MPAIKTLAFLSLLGAQLAGGALLLHGAPALPFPAAGSDRATDPRTGAARVVTITARDFAFEAPDTVQAGLTTLRLLLRGSELHHAMVVRLIGGKTLADFGKAMQSSEQFPSWAIPMGGPQVREPGGESKATLYLDAGSYVLLCVVPSADGKPHVMKGMVRGLTVVGRGSASRALPAADIDVTLDNFDFRFSRPLTRGAHVIRVRNVASQPHEIVLFRLLPGKTAPDVVSWIEKQDGPPPAAPIGGLTPVAHGVENVFPADLQPGEYALVCFIPDEKDGKPHFAHGMIKQITVN